MPDPIPKAVSAKAGQVKGWGLIVWLDGKDAFVEFSERKHVDFIQRLDKWRANGRDGLDPKRCNVRFYLATPMGLELLRK